MIKLYGFKKGRDMVKNVDTISEMYNEREKREEQDFQASLTAAAKEFDDVRRKREEASFQELCKAAKEFDEEKKRARRELESYLDYVKMEALFAYDTGGEVVTRKDNEFGVRVIIKHRDIGHKLFTKKLQHEEEGIEE